MRIFANGRGNGAAQKSPFANQKTMIKNLIFDFGKVLVDYDFEAFFRSYIPSPERCSRFTRLICTPESQAAFDREIIPMDTYIEQLATQHTEFADEIRLFRDRYPELVTGEIAGMRTLLAQLKAEGFRLYGLTNWCSKVYDTMQEYEIFRLLDGAVVSSDVHLIKPEPDIYRHLLAHFSLRADECVFADDRPENIAGGEAVGIRGIVFENAGQYERELRKLLAANA